MAFSHYVGSAKLRQNVDQVCYNKSEPSSSTIYKEHLTA